MTQESRAGKTFLDEMLFYAKDSQRASIYQLDESETERLTTWTHSFEDMQNEGLTGEDIYGCLGERAIFHRFRRKSNGLFIKVQWILAGEGPLKNIRYHNGWDGKRELILGYDSPRLGLGVGGKYSIDSGEYEDKNVAWSNHLLESSTKLETREVKEKDKVRIYGLLDDKQVQEIVLPRNIELKKWLPIFFDDGDKIVNDSNLPWQNWFDEIGLEYRTTIRN